MLLIVSSQVIFFPFELVDEIKFKGHFWDRKNKVHKYKIEYNKVQVQVVQVKQHD